jgi:hypothetical protein
MKKMSRILAAATFALALPLALSAQTPTPAAPASEKLEVGKWTGSVTPPGGQPLALVFDVTAPGDTMKIDLLITDMGATFPLTAIKLEGKKLTFGFLAGDTDVKCTLEKKDDGSFAGPCADASGEGGPMTMTPPKKGAPTP